MSYIEVSGLSHLASVAAFCIAIGAFYSADISFFEVR
jgi:hypothetical protein